MKITWQVEDGYAGKSRPQSSEIPDEEFVGLTDDEKEDVITNWIQNDFEQNVSWSIISRSDES